jgi:putative bacteriocin precursor
MAGYQPVNYEKERICEMEKNRKAIEKRRLNKNSTRHEGTLFAYQCLSCTWCPTQCVCPPGNGEVAASISINAKTGSQAGFNNQAHPN